MLINFPRTRTPRLAPHPAPPHTVPHAPAQGGTASALMAADVRVFRHEFITQFRFSHRATVHPADMHILEPIAEHATLYEADKGTVFLARDVVARLQRHALAARRAPAPARGCFHPNQHRSLPLQYAHHHHHAPTRIAMAAARMSRA